MIWVSVISAVVAACALVLSFLNWRRLVRLDDDKKVDLHFKEIAHPEYALVNRGTETAWLINLDLNSAPRFHFSDTGPAALDPGESQKITIRNQTDPTQKLPSVRGSWGQSGFAGRMIRKQRFISVEGRDT